MNWSAIPPTSPGWYWFRHHPSSNAQCVQVQGTEGEPPEAWHVFLVGITRPLPLGRLTRASGRATWAGPIEVPAGEVFRTPTPADAPGGGGR